ncbi:hypothetical protein TWF694_009179 [Orbilia ellipsospora]|uniref:Ammonium transporter AmtB-like domain-containing protein n=1 Tax=Orbilia ellipsospora TaxID=2528407 RepID=A0AAV9XKT7_9PEZI
MQAGTEVTPGDVSWILTSSALVWIMIPAVGLIYSGSSTRQSALSMLWLSLTSLSIVTFQWWLWGYSLAFSRTSKSSMIGDMNNVVLLNVMNSLSASEIQAPELAFAVYQGMFAAFTMAVVAAATAQRGRTVPFMVFTFLWTTLVYDFIVFWSWNNNGWLNTLGSLDWAGGSPVHISSGAASLAYSLVLGPRYDQTQSQDIFHILLGSLLLWFGWFGFNAGTALRANLRAFVAFLNTNLAASCGGLTWVLMDRFFGRRFRKNVGHWSLAGFMSGAVAGLVCITPGAGYVPPWSSPIFGLAAALVCNSWTSLTIFIEKRFSDSTDPDGKVKKPKHMEGLISRFMRRYDDPFEVFAIHAIGGLLGLFLTGIFASNEIVALDPGAKIDPKGMGVIDHNSKRLGYQIVDGLACFSWSFFMTLIIVLIMDRIPGLSLRYTGTKGDENCLDEYEFGTVERLTNPRTPDGFIEHDSTNDVSV